MQKFFEATGENRDAAVENALKQLGLERDDVSVEVLEIGKKGFLGIGATPARVRVTYEAPDIPAAKPEVKKEERKPAPKTKAAGEACCQGRKAGSEAGETRREAAEAVHHHG